MDSFRKYADVEHHNWRLHDIDENEKYFVIGRYNEQDLTRKTHTHEFIQIYFIMDGILKHDIENVTGYVSKGDIFILPPGMYHHLEIADGKHADYISIGFMPFFIDYSYDNSSYPGKFLNFILIQNVLKDEIKIKPGVSFTKEMYFQIENLITNMLNEYNMKTEGYLLYIKGHLLSLLVLIAREYVSTQHYKNCSERFLVYNEAIIKSIKYVDNNFMEDLKIDDISKQFLLSRTYFCELFKKYTGRTFNEYINELRLCHAKMLLKTTQSSITEIAYSSGFHDSTSFCRKFTKKIGVSPSAFRKMI